MSNNNFYYNFIETNRSIFIPVLQRDYVQGERPEIINPFIDELLDSSSKEVNLNYIYGYEKNNNNEKYFIPVDGQQRLITLWLFHFYFYKEDTCFPQLIFASREYANSFSKAFYENCLKKEPVKDLENQNWFVTSWLKDRTVKNMINTWKNIYSKNSEIINIKNLKINFEFYDINHNNDNKSCNLVLDDGIYIKMNGRGRPLSYFDNLKSFLDEIVEKSSDKDFINLWQDKMDNEWTDLVWNNRNMYQKHPEEIDDELSRLFYNLLGLFWYFVGEEKLWENLNKEPELVKSFLNVNVNKRKDVISKLLNLIREKDYSIPLFYLEKFNLFYSNNSQNRKTLDKENIFYFIETAIDKINNLKDLINNGVTSNLYYKNSEEEKNTTLFYQLAMSKNSLLRLSYFWVLICTPCSCNSKENFNRWIRLNRNLLINSQITSDKMFQLVNSIFTLSSFLITDDFYKDLSSKKDEFITLKGFSQDQLYEELYKIQLIDTHKDLEIIFKDFEEFGFNKGAIRFVLPFDTKNNLIFTEESKMEDVKQSIINKSKKFQEIFSDDSEKLLFTKCFLKQWTPTWKEEIIKFGVDLRDILINKKYCFRIGAILASDDLQKFAESKSQETLTIECARNKINDLLQNNNQDNKYEFSKIRLKSLIADKQNLFLDTLFHNSNLFNNSRLFRKSGYAFYPAYCTSTLIYLDKPFRDVILFILYNNQKITFEKKDNNTIFDKITPREDNSSLPFLIGDDIHFMLNNVLFSWDRDNKISIFKNKNWIKVNDVHDQVKNCFELKEYNQLIEVARSIFNTLTEQSNDNK